MKRSKRIATLTLGGAFVVMLANCGDSTEDMTVYKSVEECIAATGDKPLCEGEMTAARLNHEDSAPRFQDEQSCQQEFDNCTAVTDVHGGTSWFMPAMTGFILGRLIGQSTAQPVFYDRKGYAFVRNLPADMRRDDKTYWGSSSTTTDVGGGSGSKPAAATSSGGYSRVSAGSSSGSVSVSRGGFGSSGSSSSS